MMRHQFIAAAVLMWFSVPAAGQGFVDPDAFGWSRGDAESTHHEWDDFVSAAGPNAPDVADFPASIPGGTGVVPSVTETTGVASITSTGNLYSIENVLEFEVVVPTFDSPGGTIDVLLQTRTQGREIDAPTLLANGLAPVETVELFRFVLGPDTQFGGSLVDTLWRFELPAAESVTIEFVAADTSMSLDRVSVDTRTVANDCPGDVNRDGVLNGSDFFAWVAAFGNNDPVADVNLDGEVNGSDFFAWVAAFGAGC